MTETRLVYTPDEFVEIQKLLGERPGNYHVDPNYLRRGIGNKAYLWLDGGWKLLNPGDLIIRYGDGTIRREKKAS